MKKSNYILIALLALIMSACGNEPKFNIGVSQCSEDDWRELLNLEIQREARFQGDINVEVLSADDNSDKQIADINKFVDEGKDLIIVAPNVAEDVRPAIEKAYDRGIPVILIDRRITGEKYTAFIGANNRLIGEQMAGFLNDYAQGRQVNVVELRGLKGSSPEIERHEGFHARLGSNISVIADAYADWREADGRNAMAEMLKNHAKIDFVYAHNDRMAKGALAAIEEAGRKDEIKVVGVDALVFDGGGVDMVMNRELLASFIYPTGGSEAIILAKKILNGESFEREIELPAALVDEDNARVMKLQYQSMKAQDEKYEKLETLSARQLEQIMQQRWMLGGAIAIVCLLALVLFTQYNMHKEKKQADDILMQALQSNPSTLGGIELVAPRMDEADCGEPVGGDEEAALAAEAADSAKAPESVSTETSAEPETNANEPLKEPSQKLYKDIRAEIEVEEIKNFRSSVEKIIIAHIGDSSFSVNDIAAELGMSRVQLYRKIKAMSDQNVSDLIKRARLEKARELLTTTNRTVSEIAYTVGFSSPSYFTKCFKDYYGYSPSVKY